MRCVALLSITLLCATATLLPAQELYVSGGIATASREPGWFPSLATPSAPAAANVAVFTGGFGVWLDDIGVEGSISMTTAQPIVWHYGYLFDETGDKRTEDRDVPLLGFLRIAPLRNRTASIEPVVGGGITFHRGATVTTADCGYGALPTTCVPVKPPRADDVFTTTDWMLALGVDVALRASSRLSIVPGFRAGFAQRELFVTGYDHRGPYSGGGRLWSVGVTARYLVH